MAALASVATISATAQSAFTAETTTTSWSVAGAQKTATNTFLSGLGVSIELVGPSEFQSGAARLNDLGGTAAMFAPAMPVGTNGALSVNTNPSGILGQPGICGTGLLGEVGTVRPCSTMTITFEHPVRNPTFHIAGGGAGVLLVSNLSASHSLTATGQSFVPPGSTGRTNMTVTPATFERVGTGGASNDCSAILSEDAVCGSAPTSLTAAVVPVALNVRVDAGLIYLNDNYRLQWSVDEDFGDAPSSYEPGTDARHVLSDLALGSGGAVTPEHVTTIITNTTPSPNAGSAASSDTDNAFGAIPAVNGSATTYALAVPVSGISKAATLCGWIDFNRDGDFDNPSERACATAGDGAGSVALSWTLPAGTAYVAGNSYARFRLGYDAAAVQVPTGAADSGEVEDHTIALLPRVRLDKTVTPAGSGLFNLSIAPTVLPAGSIVAANQGNGGTTGFATVAFGTSVTFNETAGTGTSLSGFATTRTCVNRAGATVLPSASGTSGAFTSMTSASSSGNATPATAANIDNTEITCTLTNTTTLADISVSKSNNASSVTSGTTTTYIGVASNGGPAAANGAGIQDTPASGLSGCVVNSCTPGGAATCPAAPGNLLTGGTVVPTFPSGGSVTFSITCNVD